MTRPMSLARPWSRGLAAIALFCAGLPAYAVSTQWQCTGYRPLEVDSTPQEAHVHFDGQEWTLRRQHDYGEARYVDSRHGVSIITRGRALTLMHGDERLACKLLSDALGTRIDAPASAASAAH